MTEDPASVTLVSKAWEGDYRAFVDECKTIMRRRVRRCEPADDPQPLTFGHADGRFVAVGIPGFWMQSGGHKRALVDDVLVPLIRDTRPRKFAWSSSAWGAASDTPLGHEVERRQVAGEPIPWLNELAADGFDGLEEMVGLSVFDAERHEHWQAAILRSPVMAPGLGKWTLAGNRPDALEGRWIDPIVEAMR